jgi:hypothetical protein
VDNTKSDTVQYQRSAGVAQRKIADEILLVPIRTSPKEKFGLYNLNRTASFLWELLEQKSTQSELVIALQKQFAVSLEQAKADVEEFCRDLLALGFIEPLDSSAETR